MTITTANQRPMTLELAEGRAEIMGEGVFVVLQQSEGVEQSVCLTRQDLEAMLARC